MSIQKKLSNIKSSENSKYTNMNYEVQLPYFNITANSLFSAQLLNNPSLLNIYQLAMSSYL